jgi:hypothetical protein
MAAVKENADVPAMSRLNEASEPPLVASNNRHLALFTGFATSRCARRLSVGHCPKPASA